MAPAGSGMLQKMPRGRTFRLPPARRATQDLLRYWKSVPAVTQHRRLHIPRLAAERAAAARRISWPVLFMKGHALVAAETPQLRRLFLRWPYPRLYEHPTSACRMTISREVDGEDTVLLSRTFDVETRALASLDDEIRTLATAPIEESDLLTRQVNMARIPGLLRRFGWFFVANARGPLRTNFLGTFLLTTVSKYGGVSLNAPVISNNTLSFGPVDADGFVDVYLTYDHRVYDGAINAQAMALLEAKLEGPICDELIALQG